MKKENNLQIQWFKAKRYGRGWYPSTWQAWIILTVWVILAINIFSIIDKNSHSVSDTLIEFFIPLVLSVILLFFICYGTGEKPRLRWGK